MEFALPRENELRRTAATAIPQFPKARSVITKVVTNCAVRESHPACHRVPAEGVQAIIR